MTIVIEHVNQDHLDKTVPILATVSTNHVIILRVYVLLVDANVGIQAVTVAQNVVLENIGTIVINHVTGVYLIPVIKEMVTVQTNLDVNLDGSIYRPNNISVI